MYWEQAEAAASINEEYDFVKFLKEHALKLWPADFIVIVWKDR